MNWREKPQVLLVDDNEAVCTLITAILQPHYQCLVATDGNEAIEKLKTQTFAAILLDLRMPQSDGYCVLEYLHVNAAPMLRRVVVVTAALSPGEVKRARAFGIYDIVRKPFEVDELLAKVQECVRVSSDRGPDFFTSSPAVLLLLADFVLKQRLM